MGFNRDVAIIGGCGHVGLPLGLAFASRGQSVTLYDIDEDVVSLVMSGRMPFREDGAEPFLARTLGSTLFATADPSSVADAEHVIVVVGTQVDEHSNPDLAVVSRVVSDLGPHLRDGQLLVLRSTVYPGTTALVERCIASMGKDIDVSFCPERIAQGRAMTELFELPQIVAGRTESATKRAETLFGTLTKQTVRLSPEEAELAKLFTNTWRYIKFATANQLFMMANDFGLDYERIRGALTFEYPRASDLPGAGFAAGPCLLKDTMQVAAFNNNNFVLGHAAMLVNEGLPLYVVSKMEERFPLQTMTVGILGMAFKSESDDTRSSLSYKLKRILRFKAGDVVCHDPFVTADDELLALDDVLERSDVVVIGTPHDLYRDLDISVPVVDVWNLRMGSGLVS
jgi:UDP-N-acetyl-D-mannosaminuronic acid dehydrogenase